MASGPITSWQIDGETIETVTDFIFLGSKISVQIYFSIPIFFLFLGMNRTFYIVHRSLRLFIFLQSYFSDLHIRSFLLLYLHIYWLIPLHFHPVFKILFQTLCFFSSKISICFFLCLKNIVIVYLLRTSVFLFISPVLFFSLWNITCMYLI